MVELIVSVKFEPIFLEVLVEETKKSGELVLSIPSVKLNSFKKVVKLLGLEVQFISLSLLFIIVSPHTEPFEKNINALLLFP